MSDTEKVDKHVEKVIEKEKPLFQIKTLKGMAGYLTTLLAMITTVITFGVSFQTSHLNSKIEKLKINYEIETKKIVASYRERLKALEDMKTQKKEFMGEIVFLRYSVRYINAMNKYTQSETQINANKLKKSLDAFAYYVYGKLNDLLKNETDYDTRQYMKLSSKYLSFNKNIYPIPEDVIFKVEEIKRGKK